MEWDEAKAKCNQQQRHPAEFAALDTVLARWRGNAAVSKKGLDAAIIQKALNESRIQVRAVGNRRLVAKLQADFGLGKGEAEAIAIAPKEKPQLPGIDDKNGINACKLLDVALTRLWAF